MSSVGPWLRESATGAGRKRMTNPRHFDLNLLLTFEAIYETRSITKAAGRLGVTQSAVSHALNRLRRSLFDDLFVRQGSALKPTVAATALYPSFREALDSVRGAVSRKAVFDPKRSHRSFRIAIPHIAGPFIGLRLEKRVAADAPGVELRFDTRTLPIGLLLEMEEGRVDVAVDWFSIADGRFVQQQLFEDRMLLLARKNHPRIGGGPTVSQIEAERFVIPSGRAVAWVEPAAIHSVRKLISQRGWNVAFQVSELLEVPLVVAATDLLGIVPMSIAATLLSTNLLQAFPLPVKQAAFPVTLSWHAGRRHDPAHIWLRGLVRHEVRKYGATALALDLQVPPRQ